MKEELTLTQMGETFPGRDSLRRSPMEGFGGSERDERMIAAAEGDIVPRAGGMTVAGDADSPDTGGFERLRLSADRSVTFPAKEALKRAAMAPGAGAPARRFAPRPVFIGTASIAAAAVAAFVLLLPAPTARDASAVLAAGGAGPASASVVIAPKANDAPPATNDTPAPKTADNAAHGAIAPPAEVTPAATQPVTGIAASPANENYALAAGHDLVAQGAGRIVIRVVHDEQPVQPSDVRLSSTAQLLQRLAEAAPPERTQRGGLDRMLSPIDRMAGGSMVAINRLLGRETTVIKEYDQRGNLTHYAVYTPTTAMEKNYK